MKKLIIGNWKLNPMSLTEAQDLAHKIERPGPHVVICPPVPFLQDIDYPNLGAQDCFWKMKGAFTGEVSPPQLASLGVKYCLVGHSERRTLGETDEMVNAKAVALLEYKITPIVCVGYGTTVEEDDLEVTDVIKQQLDASLATIDPSKVIVAYEPVWAISTGDPYKTKKIPTPEHAEKISLFIQTKYGVTTVLYGGSANSSNAEGFLKQPHIGGLLVGGASLLPDDFNKIIELV
jgi:triosephosphate isomerase (TIM)